MNNNYKCNKCNKEYFIPATISKIVDGNIKRYDKSTGKELICEDCGEILESLRKFTGEAPYCVKAIIDRKFETPRWKKEENKRNNI